jgi:hypothetical protein
MVIYFRAGSKGLARPWLNPLRPAPIRFLADPPDFER